MRNHVSTLRYALAFILTLSVTALMAQVHYLPGSYGGYSMPTYGYQENDSTYRIIYLSKTSGTFVINADGKLREETDFFVNGSQLYSWVDAEYLPHTHKLIVSANTSFNQFDMKTGLPDWKINYCGLTSISSLPDGRIAGYLYPYGGLLPDSLYNQLLVLNSSGIILDTIHVADSIEHPEFPIVELMPNRFITLGNKQDLSDTLNGQFTVLYLFDDSLNLVKKLSISDIRRVDDFIVTKHSQLLIASTPIIRQEWSSGTIIKQWGFHLLSLVDTTGAVLWTDTLDDWRNEGRKLNDKVVELSDGNFLYIYQRKNSRWLMFTKILPNGNVLKIDSIGYDKIAALGKFPKPEFTGYCFPVSIEKTLDNGYYLVWENKVPTFQSENDYGCWAMKFDSLGNFWWPWSTGIKEAGSIEQITIYPNPATTAFTIKTDATIQNIELFDITGHQIPIQASKGIGIYNVSFSSLPAGVYLLKYRNAKEENYVKKILIE